ncbi:hypothetical protein [Caballeronia sp. RCC_10]|uniref:hypothetical protein n=1 Tax=Caballeronia sp. RCC_10 TaxID=3239227 RepID=UPI003523EC71
MCIALAPRAAGEGDSHPQEPESLSTDTTNLPWVILRAVHRAARLDGVSTRARAVLCALARTVDAAKPYGEIFARRTLLSERAMQSERTFYRSLADLEQAGLIMRPPQRRYVEAGLFGRAYLHLTPKATILLGLVEEETASTAIDDQTDGEEVVVPVAQGFEAPYANMTDGANTKDLDPKTFQKRQPGRVPADLQRLRTLGFVDFLIFKLMREAREAGKRLSDVVEVCWQHLRQAKRPINYLRVLLASTTDFGHRLRTKVAELNAAQTAACKRKEAESFVQSMDGHTFADATGQTRYTVAEAGATLVVFNVAEGVTRRSVGQWAEGFVQAIAKGHIAKQASSRERDAGARLAIPRETLDPIRSEPPRQLTSFASEHLGRLRALCRRP